MGNENISNSPTKPIRTFAWPYVNELPIVAYSPIPFKPSKKPGQYGTPEPEPITEEERQQIYTSIKECGFNTVLTQSNEYSVSAQQPPENNGINVIICSNRLHQSAAHCYDALIEFMGKKNVVAWNIKDEPGPNMWGDVFFSFDKASGYNQETLWNQLTVGYEMASGIDPSRISMFNLAVATARSWLGSFGKDGQPVSAAITRYRAYLDNLNTLYQCPIWSYDYYPIRNKLKDNPLVEGKKEVLEGQYDVEYDMFFTYLGIFQEFTKSNNSRFWAFGLCYAHKIYDNRNWDNLQVSYPIATEGMMRFEVFCALLYGAQGISYYRYGLGRQKEHIIITNHDTASGSTKYIYEQENIMAPLSFKKNGDSYTLEKSEIWYNVKKINEEIRDFQDIFLGCTVTGHKPYSTSPESLSQFESITSFQGNVTDINGCIHMIGCDSPGVMLSSFTNGLANGKTRHYVAVMNLNPLDVCKVVFNLKKGHLLPKTGHLVPNANADSEFASLYEAVPNYSMTYSFTLKAGGMIAAYWDE